MFNLNVKVVLLGDAKVGKTSIRKSYMGNSFRSNYLATIGCDFSSFEIWGERRINMAIWDIAGQQKYETIHPYYFQGASVAILVYDVTNTDTLDSCEYWLDRYFKYSMVHRPLVYLVGNKIDLNEEVNEEDHEEKIFSLLKKYDGQIHALHSYRTSAKTGENITDMFTEIANITTHVKEREISFTPPSVEDIVPHVYSGVFNELVGPMPSVSCPFDTDIVHSQNVIRNMARLLSALDFEDMLMKRVHMGRIPWTTPAGTCLFVAFVIDNPKARGGHELHVIAAIIGIEFSHAAIQIENQLLGELHNAVNEVGIIMEEGEESLALILPDSTPDNIIPQISEVLCEVRNKVYKKIVQKLSTSAQFTAMEVKK